MEKKRIFLFLLAVCLLALAVLAVILVYLLFYPGGVLALGLTAAALMAVVVLLLFCGLGTAAVVFTLLYDRPPGKLRRMFIRSALSLYPWAMKVGKLFGLSSRRMQASFIELNNRLVLTAKGRTPAKNILILLPHCLQKSDCPYKVANDIHLCRQCGGCDIGALKALAQRLGVGIAVVNGGTLARRQVAQLRPQAVVAVACERDLFSGIVDIRPVPVLGVGNRRPCGPCHNTRVDIGEVEAMVNYFLTGQTPILA